MGAGAGEDALGTEDVDAAVGVDELGDVHIAGDGDERVGVVPREMGEVGILLGQERDHVADRHLGGSLQVLAEAHGDVSGRCLGAGPQQPVGGIALVDDELEGARQKGLEGGDVDLTVALACVTVPGFEESPLGVDGDVQGGAGDHLLVVDVAGVHPGRSGVVFGAGGCDAHRAEERMQRQRDSGGKAGGHFLAVERDDLHARVGEVVRQESAAGGEAVAGEIGVEVDLLDADFERVAGFRFGDGDRASEDVAARAALGLGTAGVDGGFIGGNFGGMKAKLLQSLGRAAGGERLHDDGVAGVHREHGLRPGPVVPPGDRGGSGEQSLLGRQLRGRDTK